MLKAGERVMRAIALSLNLPLNYFESTFNHSFWVKLSFSLLILYKYRLFVFRLFDVSVIQLYLKRKLKHVNLVKVVVNILIMVG